MMKNVNSPEFSYRLSRKGWLFTSSRMEKLYQDWHLSEMLPYSRLAAFSGMATWVIGLVLIEMVLGIDQVPETIPYIILFILTLSAMLLMTSLREGLHRYVNYVSIAIINSEIFFTIWLLEIYLGLPNTANQVVILFSFYAFGLSRLPPQIVLMSVIPGISYTFYFHISNYLGSSISLVSFSANAFMLYASIFIGLLFLFKFEQILRKEFSSMQFIEYQKKLLLEEKAQLSKFMAPEVSEMVHNKGIEETLSVKSIDLSAVYCDLRGFTHFTEVNGSEKMARLLHDYYQIVIDTTKLYGGTIKDFAGDGILILLGAPIEKPDHKALAVRLARDILVEVHKLTRQHSSEAAPLGIGVGVASGLCSVGAIGTNDRLEYTAIGSPVNLSARLCSYAKNREIVIAKDTLDGVEKAENDSIEALKLTGFEGRVRAVIQHI